MSGSNRSARNENLERDETDFWSLFTYFMIIAFMACIPFLSNYTSEQRHSKYAEICASDGKQRLALIESLSGYKGTDKETQERRNQTNWCDLASQEKVANSARWSTISAWAITVLTLIGVIFLARTLYYTRRTLDEAREAANSAKEHVGIAKHEQRPWLVIENKMFGDFMVIPRKNKNYPYDLMISWVFHYWFNNRGKSTAHVTEVRYQWICADSWYDAEQMLPDLVSGKIGHRSSGKGPIFSSQVTETLPFTGFTSINKQSPNSKQYAFIICVKYTNDNRSLEGVDARCFVLQQLGPRIGPRITEYRASDSSRIIE